MKPKFKLNELVYLVRGTALTKCNIEEIVEHTTQNQIIIKYIVRPFGKGVKECIVMNENEIVITCQEAIKKVREQLDENYELSKRNLEMWTDEFFNNMEKKFQETQNNS